MRHRNSGRQLGRESSHRKAMMQNLTNSLFEHELIKTTLPRAKELRRVAEPLITRAATDTVANRRLAFSRLRNKDMVGKLFDERIFVSGFFFPVVPRGQARIRMQMNAALTQSELDKALEEDLLSDKKELAEHLMLLDLGRNDTGKVSKIGTVRPTEEFIIERYSHVMHIVSNVVGELADDQDALSALLSGLPAGTVSGAPKVRAMEIIDELEPEKRGVYGGGVGYFSSGGDMDICIALRTAIVKDQKLYIQAGGGVVYDSDPEAEFQETVNKSKALMTAATMARNFN